MLQERADISSVRAVTVADREEVAVLQAHNVRIGHVRILVDLVGVMRRNSTLCCKGELRDNVHYLVLVVLTCAIVSTTALLTLFRLTFISSLLVKQAVNCGRQTARLFF